MNNQDQQQQEDSNLPELPDELLEKLLKNPKILMAVTRMRFHLFFRVFFRQYRKSGMAPFHVKFFKIGQDERVKRAVVIGFRGCGKSTLLNTVYIAWAIMGILKKKNVAIASQTQNQAQGHLKSIRAEIESNPFLRKIFGPFEEGEDEWRASRLVIPKYGAQITAMSVEEGKRGGRFGPHRPDLIIIDDIEDVPNARTQEARDKTFDWLTGEIMQLGDKDTKMIFLGSIVHMDSALLRIEKLIKEGEMPGVHLRVPFIDRRGKVAWPAMFPTPESVEEFRKGVGPEHVWAREYLLHILPGDRQIVKPEDIHYYDERPPKTGSGYPINLAMIGHGIDLAISKEQTADYTAIVSGEVYYIDEAPKIFIKPNPFHARVNFTEFIAKAREIGHAPGFRMLYIEDAGYQRAAIEVVKRWGIPVRPMKPERDKTSRLQVASMYIKDGNVLFPRKGCENLLNELFDFGSDGHDDLVDALVYLIFGLCQSRLGLPKIHWIDW